MRAPADRRLPFACRAALATSAAGWPAAGYGALAIWVAGNFGVTGSGWIFGWPFVALLVAATLAHQILMGIASPLGLPAPQPSVRALNRVLGGAGVSAAAAPADLATGLRAIVRLPLWNALAAGVLSLAVVAGCEMLEWWVAGPASPNFGVIGRSGVIAAALYVSASLTLGELLVRPACRQLRREALARGLRVDDAFVLARQWRIAAAVVPPAAALMVAVEMGRSSGATASAYGALILLSVVVAGGLAWLQHESHERAAREVAGACNALASGQDGHLVTGSIDPALLAIAREFNAAARQVGADRRASADRYRALFDGAGDAILLVDVASGRIVEASARAERLFATPCSALVGRDFMACVDEATRERLREFALEQRAHADVALVNAAIVRPDGTAIPVDASISLVAAGGERLLQAILRDVRDRQRIEEALRQAARRFEELYRLAVVLSDDASALGEHTVRALAELLECPMAGVLRLEGEECVVMSAFGDEGLLRSGRFPAAGTPAGWIQARRAPYVSGDLAAEFPQARVLLDRGITSYLGVPISDGQGEVVGLVAVLDRRVRSFGQEDVRLLSGFAWRLGLVLERDRLAREREALTAGLVESDRVKTEFLGMMSHELRTPLNIVVGYTRMLLECVHDGDVMSSAERAEILSRMLAGGLHLGELVEDTLSVLRLEAGVVQVDPGSLALPPFFEELQGIDRLLRRPSDVVERWEVEADVPVLVTDRRKLRQVLTNLVGNARKFTDRGMIEVRAARDRATGGVVITVRDTGCGIDATHLPHVFDLYRQAPTERRQDGCGLGLYIVRRYVELLGGRVACESAVGVGTTFNVFLPAALAPAEPASSRAA